MRARQPFDWTDERRKRVSALWDDGHSATEIGMEFGVTRNAVIGIIHRMGKGRGGALERRRAVAMVEKAKRKPAAPRPAPSKPNVITWLNAPDEYRDLPPDQSPFACTLMELTLTSCRWPLGNPNDATFRFCGAEQFNGHPYCARHCRMAYRRPEPKEAAA